VAKQVGGVVWLPFVVAFVVALVTAFSYLELVTKYPKAAGAALYTHKAFGIHFVTFIVAFAVMCSGITSASTASRSGCGWRPSAGGRPATSPKVFTHWRRIYPV
jgi:amino acid transporter